MWCCRLLCICILIFQGQLLSLCCHWPKRFNRFCSNRAAVKTNVSNLGYLFTMLNINREVSVVATNGRRYKNPCVIEKLRCKLFSCSRRYFLRCSASRTMVFCKIHSYSKTNTPGCMAGLLAEAYSFLVLFPTADITVLGYETQAWCKFAKAKNSSGHNYV